MGPVAFEAMPVGFDGTEARRQAALVKAEGIRVDLIGDPSAGFKLMVRSHDGQRVAGILQACKRSQ